MNYKILLIIFQIVQSKFESKKKTVQTEWTFKWNFDSEIIFSNQIKNKELYNLKMYFQVN